MSIKYYANRVQESSTTIGSGNLVLAGATSGYRTFASSIGANNYFTYYIYRTDLPAFEWEVGSGYITSSGGVTQLVRDSVITSSNGTALTIFTSGTKYIEPIIGEDRVNSSFLNLEEKSASFTAPYMPATYIIDSSSNNVTVTLPTVVGEDPITIGFLLNKTSGNQYEQTNAILISPSGTETINGTSSYDISIRNDYVQIVSVPSQSGWLVLDPIQDSTSAYGNNGNIQFAQNQAFSGVSALSWDTSTGSLSIGGTGTLVSSDIILPTGSQTVVFNEQSLDKDFRVEGSGSTHTLFVDASTNYVGIRTSNPTNPLTVASSSGLGISVQASGSGPVVALYNSSVSGVVSNSSIGSIVFSGLNSAGSPVPYAQIDGRLLSNTNGSENSEIQLQIYNAGSQEPVASFSPSGVTLGFNSSNIDGVLIGNTSANEGNNVTLGYNNSVCGENCVVLGNDMVVSSGTFGGAIGYDHAVSGTNLWVIGGSGISVSGSNATYIGLTDDTYIRLTDANNIDYVTQSTGVFNLNIKNTSVLSSGNSQQIVFEFVNSSGVAKSGLVLSSVIVDPTSGSEDSRMAIKQLYNGSMVDAMQLYGNSVVVGANVSSGNNIVYGHDNTVGSSGNIVYGKNISVSGSNNIALGHTITASGTNISIFGNNNECAVSGSLGVVIMGNTNTANEDYVLSIGHNNASSGLYSVACGYNNGSHGSYSVGIGSDNTVVANASIAVGRSNNLSNTSLDASIFTCGIGNTANISGSGSLIGHSNELYGSGGFVGGIDCYSSGLNNVVVGRDSRAVGTGNIVLANNVNVTGTNNMVFGSGIQWSGNNSIIGSGSYIKLSTGSGLISSSGSSILASGASVSTIGSTINISGVSSVAISSPSISSSGSSIINTASDNSVSIQNTGISILGPSGVYVSGVIDITNNAQYMSIHNTGITINSSNTTEIYASSGLLNRIDGSRYINIATTGTSIIHSSGIILENSSNGHNIDLVNSGLNITTTTSSGLNIISINGFSESARARVYHDNISLQSSSSILSVNSASGIYMSGIGIDINNGTAKIVMSSSTISGTGENIEFISSDVISLSSATSVANIRVSSTGAIVDGSGTYLIADNNSVRTVGGNDSSTTVSPTGTKISAGDNILDVNNSGIDMTYGSTIINLMSTGVRLTGGGSSIVNISQTGTDVRFFGANDIAMFTNTSGVSIMNGSGLLTMLPSGIRYTGYSSTGGGTTLVIEDNVIKSSTSSARYKENIRPYDKGLNTIANIEPVYYNFKDNPTLRAGLIAESIADLGLEEFIVRNADNSVESVNYHHMIALLINAIKDLKKEVDELKNR